MTMGDGARSGGGGDPVGEGLDRLARATAEIRPADGFADSILLAVASDAAAGIDGPLWRLGRFALAGFVAAAVACVLWSSSAASSLDEGVLASFETVEWEP